LTVFPPSGINHTGASIIINRRLRILRSFPRIKLHPEGAGLLVDGVPIGRLGGSVRHRIYDAPVQLVTEGECRSLLYQRARQSGLPPVGCDPLKPS